MKSNLRVWNNLIRRTEPHVLVIALLINFSAIGAETINEPRLIEGSSMAAGERIFKFSDGSLQSRESHAENLVNGAAAAGPVGRDRVETAEYSKNSGTKFYGGGAEGNEPLNRKRAKDGDKGGQNDKYTSRDVEQKSYEIIAHVFLGFLLVAIPMIPVFMQKHNDRLQWHAPASVHCKPWLGIISTAKPRN